MRLINNISLTRWFIARSSGVGIVSDSMAMARIAPCLFSQVEAMWKRCLLEVWMLTWLARESGAAIRLRRPPLPLHFPRRVREALLRESSAYHYLTDCFKNATALPESSSILMLGYSCLERCFAPSNEQSRSL